MCGGTIAKYSVTVDVILCFTSFKSSYETAYYPWGGTLGTTATQVMLRQNETEKSTYCLKNGSHPTCFLFKSTDWLIAASAAAARTLSWRQGNDSKNLNFENKTN